ncbi:tetratricopeptide repeat protein [Marinobacter sp. F4218]|uniref:tetratricopeptide repeat protein n=1 Tax=Marinobacter sp. F4218 TaxID=2862868 RepID=UPI001C630AFE|nr:tetratricopeptide repeat protein [Marinobacter sp. F4218]MBW7472153.1 tetratricopeptide repeat protein [Marinobacter sp. F4218]
MPFISVLVVIVVALLTPGLVVSEALPGPSAEDQGYVAEGTCASCHQKEQHAWSDSDHAWAMHPASSTSVLGDFGDRTFSDGAVTARFFQRDGDYWVETEGEDGKPGQFRIAYTFGHFPLQQYLVAFPGGRLQALTIAWDTRTRDEGGQRWFSLYPGERFAPDDALHWTGRYQNWNAMCADCHSTYLSMNYDAQTDSFATTWQEQNVGCQGCHGPGQDHVDWARTKSDDPGEYPRNEGNGLKIDFDALAGPEVVETCAFCHSRRQSLKDGQHVQEPYFDKALPATLRPDLYHADGQIQGEVYVYGSFVQSKMAAAGVDCLDCHDPHTTELLVEGNGLCLQCHNASPPERFPQLAAGDYDDRSHHRHPADSEGAQCVNCHMPDKTYMEVDPRRDHSFRIPRPDLTLTTGSPNACNDCHDDKSADWAVAAIDDWFESPRRPPHFANALSAFRRAEADGFIRLAALIRDTGAPAIARATAAEHLGDFGPRAGSALRTGLLTDDPLVQAYAANSVAQLPASDRVNWLRKQLAEDQAVAVRDQALRSLAGVDLSTLPDQDRARIAALKADYEQRLRALATLPGNRLNLATYLQREGRPDEAIAQYRRALAMDPLFVPARVNLATLASEQGRIGLAVEMLTEGAELDGLPDADRGHLAYLLALALVEEKRPSEALPRFEQAGALNPGNPRVAYNHGLVLAQMGKVPEAEQVLGQALARHPEDHGLLSAMIYLKLQQGHLSEALAFARKLKAAHPNDQQVDRLIRDLSARVGG